MKTYYLFDKSSLPAEIDEGISDSLSTLSNISEKSEYLRATYDIITSKYEGGRVKTLGKLFDLFSDGVQSLWNRSGFMHCTNQNYLLTLLLVRGGLFKEKDIIPRWTLIWFFSPHQYLEVKVGDETINIDAWGKTYGIPFGDYAHGFNTKLWKMKR